MQDEIQKIYRARFSDADRRAKDRLWRILVETVFQKWIRPTDTVLDLGCGFGEFLNHIHAARRIGVDLNPDTPSHLAPGIQFYAASACDLSFLDDATVDVAFASNLLEHLAGKAEVEQLLREARRVLKPGGQLILLGPNLRFLPGQYWDFWDHRVPITDRSLAELLGAEGFAITQLHPRFLPYTTRCALPQAPWLLRLYLRLPLAWHFVGRQFLIRAQKPAARESTAQTPAASGGAGRPPTLST